MNNIEAIHELGQSLWLDFISRELLTSGELERLIKKDEVRGVTSNPTIFEQAIAKTDQYTDVIYPRLSQGRRAEEILDDLILEDIRSASKLFLPQYQNTNGSDGFVSIEVNPDLAHDPERTLMEARRIWETVNRPNLMIKIPATKMGITAIRQAITEGINVNVTLIFSRDRYTEVIDAYLSGLEQRLESDKPINQVASVASFFVSRVDTAVDHALEEIQKKRDQPNLLGLFGKAAIANAKLAYDQFQSTFDSARFEKLSKHGARVQRPLWASTSTKNPTYPDTYYVDNLIGPYTVNTLPPQTLEAFKDHGRVEVTIDKDLDGARDDLKKIEEVGVALKEVTTQLEMEGVEKFATSFHNLVGAIQKQMTSSH